MARFCRGYLHHLLYSNLRVPYYGFGHNIYEIQRKIYQLVQRFELHKRSQEPTPPNREIETINIK